MCFFVSEVLKGSLYAVFFVTFPKREILKYYQAHSLIIPDRLVHNNGFLKRNHSVRKPETLELNDWLGTILLRVRPIQIPVLAMRI